MGVLEINGGVRTRPFFNPFPASLSQGLFSSHSADARALNARQSPTFTETNQSTRRG